MIRGENRASSAVFDRSPLVSVVRHVWGAITPLPAPETSGEYLQTALACV
jgi:hypothetical protein